MSAIALMIEKMPHIAEDALNQFQSLDVGYRRESFYLNYLEHDPNEFRNQDERGMISLESAERLDREQKRSPMMTRQLCDRLACPSTALEVRSFYMIRTS